MSRRIAVIINPTAGQADLAYGVLDRVFAGHGIRWEPMRTQGEGDATRLTHLALKEGFDLVAVYGGDGTVREVAEALMGQQVAMGLIPGGTANVLSVELGIPRDLNRAAELIASGQPLAVDVGLAGGRVFMVALATGSLSRMMETANYETKQALGYFAYILGAYQSVVNPPTLAIRLTIDGRIIEREGIALAVSNTGNVGAKGVYIPRGTSIRDGLLDITVFRGADLETLFAMTGSAFDLGDLAPPLQHWRGESIHIDFDQPQAIAFDGDILMKTPVSVEVRQHALNVIMPSDPQTLYPKFWSSRLHDP